MTGERASKRPRGEIETLPSGALRVRVYGGADPVTGKRARLSETVPAGPKADKEAEKVKTRLLNQLDEDRAPRTSATVGQLMDKYLEFATVDDGTRPAYESLIRIHIRPLIGHVQYARIDGLTLDSFYRELRRCRAHCKNKHYTDHRTRRPHTCDDRCTPHKCAGLAEGTIRKVKAILNKAGKRAVRWGWAGTNRFELAEPLPAVRSNPHPPTAEQAAAIANEAWRDLDWGLFVWIAMVTGARRGELCALAWDRIDFTSGVLTIRSSIAQKGKRTWEKDTKTHQQRRIALDAPTVALLRAFRQRHARELHIGNEMPGSARIFSPMPDGSTWPKPDTMSQRYARMCAKLGWDMNLHQLRHYSATELIGSGVDVRTVAGRLGHSGGGTTTLRIYTAWLAEGDQRAAGSLTDRLPALPVAVAEDGTVADSPAPETGDNPYQRIAADLRGAIVSGVLTPGAQLPTVDTLAKRYTVAFGTAQRAVAQLRAAGLVTVSRGKRAVVADPGSATGTADVVSLDAKRRPTN